MALMPSPRPLPPTSVARPVVVSIVKTLLGLLLPLEEEPQRTSAPDIRAPNTRSPVSRKAIASARAESRIGVGTPGLFIAVLSFCSESLRDLKKGWTTR